MAIVLEANYCKKLGLPGYSSHQYGVTIRAELGDINQVPKESERVYRLLQTSVDRELQQTGWLPQGRQPGSAPGPARRLDSIPADGVESNGADTWTCSPKQRELILRLVEEHSLDRREVDELARERFGKGVRSLNKLEASGLIDELLERHGAKGQAARSPRRGSTRRTAPAGRAP
ncbi:hypothetical protein H5P28_00505 [Ruficoccus amylovorans]|uniref:Uncharacterized protein n=1 Tax=Ruficoccus amylovorans TaxID=1804625 RepID=A0A842H8R4_9BACT|nr:hypothetical protein [Ruficoccus amylovorans]MBC2592730.1 hypothetical protein [Ruficoccus amylovorans]